MTSGSTRCATTGIDVGDAGSWAPSLTAAAVGIAAGAKSVADVEHLTEQMPRAMRRRLGIVRRVPDTTLRDALCSIEPEQLARCLHTTVRDAERRKAIHPDALPFGVVSLDGKGTSISACDDWYAQRQSAGQGAPLVGVVRTITATLISSSARPCIDVMPIPARTNEMGRVLRAADRYRISSLRKDALTATQWQTLVRLRWGVETNHQIRVTDELLRSLRFRSLPLLS